MTPPEIEPATFRLVEQRLNQLRHRVPYLSVTYQTNFKLDYIKVKPENLPQNNL
jgi:hypothetical protein